MSGAMQINSIRQVLSNKSNYPTQRPTKSSKGAIAYLPNSSLSTRPTASKSLSINNVGFSCLSCLRKDFSLNLTTLVTVQGGRGAIGKNRHPTLIS